LWSSEPVVQAHLDGLGSGPWIERQQMVVKVPSLGEHLPNATDEELHEECTGHECH